MAKDNENIKPDSENGAVNTEAEKTAGSDTAKAEEKKDKKEKKEKKDKEKEALLSEIEKLKKERDEANDKFLRTAAEYQNFRTRSQKEKDSIYNDSKADAISKIVPVLDNFERAAASNAEPEDYKKGIEMTVKQLGDVLAALGVESFGEADETFDPNIHNGVSRVDDESLGENVIHTVYQKGYRIGDRIIRHATVIVANS